NPPGLPGRPAGVGAPPPTVIATSFEAAPTPALFSARTRTKNVPGRTLSAVNDVAGLPVEKTAASVPPLKVPASMRYEDGALPLDGAPQLRNTDEPDANPDRLVGAPGPTGAGAGGGGGVGAGADGGATNV